MLSYPSIIPLQAYVTKDGKELTGRTAYRHYRKVHLKTSFIDNCCVHFMSPNRLKALAGYRRVVQGLGSPKRKLVPRVRREKAERCSRYHAQDFVSLLICRVITINFGNLRFFQFQ
jgi:hypothetical protein